MMMVEQLELFPIENVNEKLKMMEASSISIQLHAFCFFEPVCETMESWKFNFSPKLITLLEEGGG